MLTDPAVAWLAAMQPVEVPAGAYLVRIQLPDGRDIVVDGRLSKMIEFMVNEQTRLEAIPFGWFGFNVTPRSFQPEVKRTFERVDARPDGDACDG